MEGCFEGTERDDGAADTVYACSDSSPGTEL